MCRLPIGNIQCRRHGSGVGDTEAVPEARKRHRRHGSGAESNAGEIGRSRRGTLRFHEECALVGMRTYIARGASHGAAIEVDRPLVLAQVIKAALVYP